MLPAACRRWTYEKCERRWRFSVWMRTGLLINRWFMVVPMRWQTFPKNISSFPLHMHKWTSIYHFCFCGICTVHAVLFPFAKLRSEWLNARSKYDHASKQYADDMMHVYSRRSFSRLHVARCMRSCGTGQTKYRDAVNLNDCFSMPPDVCGLLCSVIVLFRWFIDSFCRRVIIYWQKCIFHSMLGIIIGKPLCIHVPYI